MHLIYGSSLKLSVVLIVFLSGCARHAAVERNSLSQTEPAESLLMGSWTTKRASDGTTAISVRVPVAVGPQLFLLGSSSVNAEGRRYNVDADGRQAEYGVAQMSQAVVEGINVELRQTSPNLVHKGEWRVVSPPPTLVNFIKAGWGVTQANPKTQVLDLDAARHFVVTYLGHPEEICRDRFVSVRVDGAMLLQRNGIPVLLHPGSSVWVYGKSLVVELVGECPFPEGTYLGNVKLQR
ncbi:hypothetical protein ACN6A1_27670 [Myxococcus virescens]|uniref:hypothetical protein n=1 Tax=Myxococcus virescens TaxID=83456 RepID=UPI003DA27942